MGGRLHLVSTLHCVIQSIKKLQTIDLPHGMALPIKKRSEYCGLVILPCAVQYRFYLMNDGNIVFKSQLERGIWKEPSSLLCYGGGLCVWQVESSTQQQQQQQQQQHQCVNIWSNSSSKNRLKTKGKPRRPLNKCRVLYLKVLPGPSKGNLITFNVKSLSLSSLLAQLCTQQHSTWWKRRHKSI